MKKILLNILCFSFIAILLCGCEQKKSNTGVFICEINDGLGILGDSIQVETDELSYRDISENDAPQKVEKVFSGKRYIADYQESFKQAFANYTCRSYLDRDGEVIYLNAETGEVIGALYSQTAVSYPDADSRDEAAALFAGDMIDIADYSLNVNERTPVADGPKIYTYVYTRTVSGYGTADKLYINITEDGRVESFIHCMKGAFENFDLVIDDDKVQKKIDEKLAAMYGAELNSLDMAISEKTVVKTENGGYGLAVQAELKKEVQSGNLALIAEDIILLLINL